MEVPECHMSAACRLKLQLQQRVVVGDSSAKKKAADRQSIKGKIVFSVNMTGFIKTAVLCIVKFLFSKL